MATTTLALGPQDSRLIGKWVSVDGKVVGDETCHRIKELIHSRLTRVGSDASGWDTLFVDPADKRLWELIYPQSELHGGGPPTLQLIDAAKAGAKYGSLWPSNTSLERTRGK